MNKTRSLLRNRFFKSVHTQNLIYNTCWEDPRCDRQLLQLQNDSRVVMITSAGCNALSYLLDAPEKIHCIDMNFRQNALLELKKAFFLYSNYADLWQTFGKGKHKEFDNLYKKILLRQNFPDNIKNYWNKNNDYFNGRGLRSSFYYHGTSGIFAWLFKQYLYSKGVKNEVKALFEAKSLVEQTEIYNRLEPILFNGTMEWLMNRQITMSLLGVPESQLLLFKNEYERGALGFIQQCFRHIFTEIPIHDNYFYKVYLDGEYSETCRPDYLAPENFDKISLLADRISTHTTTLSDFLKANPHPYSHYVLLDHQDWLAQNDREALAEEWQEILKNSRSGTRILLRSAAAKVDFFPDFVLKAVDFEQELTSKTHFQDRVGSYASVYLMIVK